MLASTITPEEGKKQLACVIATLVVNTTDSGFPISMERICMERAVRWFGVLTAVEMGEVESEYREPDFKHHLLVYTDRATDHYVGKLVGPVDYTAIWREIHHLAGSDREVVSATNLWPVLDLIQPVRSVRAICKGHDAGNFRADIAEMADIVGQHICALRALPAEHLDSHTRAGKDRKPKGWTRNSAMREALERA